MDHLFILYNYLKGGVSRWTTFSGKLKETGDFQKMCPSDSTKRKFQEVHSKKMLRLNFSLLLKSVILELPPVLLTGPALASGRKPGNLLNFEGDGTLAPGDGEVADYTTFEIFKSYLGSSFEYLDGRIRNLDFDSQSKFTEIIAKHLIKECMK
ncbi:hypothetical protein HGM15179_013893 [Zosterops borbonicus]|uniref:Uncharacterized protein n=1 Tax=Zosterops borbonicus TaxID=364589 RepID=A0A8K1LGK4_9PASS|nr:hypothetical protein HGM15179_013893 [Zosterops borbonicus]